MIDKKSRRVVIINNIQSDSIDQAIFILKSDKTDAAAAKTDISIANEAQNIINNYIRQVERMKTAGCTPVKRKKARKLPGWFKFVLAASALAAFIFISTHII